MYQSLLDSVVMLSSFMTIITGTGGNAGSQASAMVIRGLALGDIQMRDTFKVVFKGAARRYPLWSDSGDGQYDSYDLFRPFDPV